MPVKLCGKLKSEFSRGVRDEHFCPRRLVEFTFAGLCSADSGERR